MLVGSNCPRPQKLLDGCVEICVAFTYKKRRSGAMKMTFMTPMDVGSRVAMVPGLGVRQLAKPIATLALGETPAA